jgi:hypothetical protein
MLPYAGLQELEGGTAAEIVGAGGAVVSGLEEHGLVHVQVGQEILQVLLDNLGDGRGLLIIPTQKSYWMSIIWPTRGQFYSCMLSIFHLFKLTNAGAVITCTIYRNYLL